MTSQDETQQGMEQVSRAMLAPLQDTTANLPEPLQGLFTLSAWAESLINGKPYKEPDPDYLSRLLLMQTLQATTPEQVFTPNDLDGLQKIVPDAPHMGTGPIEIDGIYIAASDKDMGTPCYMILDFWHLDTGVHRKTTTGATQLQAQILRLLGFGIWPIRCQIKRTERKDKGGRFLFWLFPPD